MAEEGGEVSCPDCEHYKQIAESLAKLVVKYGTEEDPTGHDNIFILSDELIPMADDFLEEIRDKSGDDLEQIDMGLT